MGSQTKITTSILLIISSFLLYPQSNLDLKDFKLGESKATILNKSFEQIGYSEIDDTKLYRFELPDKNAISVTLDNNKVVYIELDHMEPDAKNTDFLDFKFTDTKFADIVEKFGSKGFIYKDRNVGKMDDFMYTIECYKIKDTDEVLVFFSSIKTDDFKNVEGQSDLWKKLGLVSIAIAKENYLDSIWGKEKQYPKNGSHIVSF